MGRLYLRFWVAKLILAAGLELLIVMMRIKPVICKRYVVVTQTLSPSLPTTLQLICKEPGSAEPCWGPTCFWGDTLQNWPLPMSPPLRVFCGVGQQRGCSVGPVGAYPTASPCTHPTASHGKWEQGINILTTFWTSELPQPAMALWAYESSHRAQGRNKRQCVLRAFSCFLYFAAAKLLAF